MDSSDLTLNVAMAAFDRGASLMNLLVVPAALARVAYLNVCGSGSSEYTRVAKGVVLYFVLIFAYEPFLKLLLTLPAELLPSFNMSNAAATGVAPDNGLVNHGLALIPNVLTWTLESLITLLYYAAWALSLLATVLMSAMAPVILLTGGVLSIGLGVGTFMSLLIVLCCWPIVFSACEGMRHAMIELMPNIPGLGSMMAELVLACCKIIAPVALAKSAIQSPVGQAMKSFVSSGTTAASGGATHASNFKAGYQGREFSHQPRNISEMASEKSGKLIHQAGKKLRDIANPQSRPQSATKHNSSSTNFSSNTSSSSTSSN